VLLASVFKKDHGDSGSTPASGEHSGEAREDKMATTSDDTCSSQLIPCRLTLQLVLIGRHQERRHDVQQLILGGKVRRVLGARIDDQKINHFIILSSLVGSLKEPDHAVGSVHASLSAGPDAPAPKGREGGHHASVRGKIKTGALDDVFKLEKEGAKRNSVSVDSIVCRGKSLTNALANRLARSALGLVVAGGATADGVGVASVGGSMLGMLKCESCCSC